MMEHFCITKLVFDSSKPLLVSEMMLEAFQKLPPLSLVLRPKHFEDARPATYLLNTVPRHRLMVPYEALEIQAPAVFRA